MNKYIIISLIIVLSGLFGITIYYKSQYSKVKAENEILFNNNYAYEQDLLGLQDSLSTERGVYKLTINEINTSKDKVITELNETKKQLKIKNKELKEMTHFVASVKTDTIVNVIINDSCEFNFDIAYNPLTKFHVEGTKVPGTDSLTIIHNADISASFNAFIYDKSTWKEPEFIKRLFLFRWGKNHVERSQLTTDNDVIKIKDFRIIKIDK